MNVWSDYTQSRLNEYIFLRALLVDIWLAFRLIIVFAKITHVEECGCFVWLFILIQTILLLIVDWHSRIIGRIAGLFLIIFYPVCLVLNGPFHD